MTNPNEAEIEAKRLVIEQLIFVGFNSRVAALRRDTGELVWNWRSPKGTGYTTVLLDGDQVIASVIGYTYALDAATGQQRWANALGGMGVGVATLASVHGCSQNAGAAAAQIQEQNHHAAQA